MAKKEQSEAAKDALRRHGFKKGQSGNPKGRPPLPEELKLKAAELTPIALDKMSQLMNCENDMVAFKATEFILGLFMSKAAQKIDVDHNHMHRMDDLMAKASSARASLAKSNTIDAEVIDMTSVEVLEAEQIGPIPVDQFK